MKQLKPFPTLITFDEVIEFALRGNQSLDSKANIIGTLKDLTGCENQVLLRNQINNHGDYEIATGLLQQLWYSSNFRDESRYLNRAIMENCDEDLYINPDMDSILIHSSLWHKDRYAFDITNFLNYWETLRGNVTIRGGFIVQLIIDYIDQYVYHNRDN